MAPSTSAGGGGRNQRCSAANRSRPAGRPHRTGASRCHRASGGHGEYRRQLACVHRQQLVALECQQDDEGGAAAECQPAQGRGQRGAGRVRKWRGRAHRRAPASAAGPAVDRGRELDQAGAERMAVAAGQARAHQRWPSNQASAAQNRAANSVNQAVGYCGNGHGALAHRHNARVTGARGPAAQASSRPASSALASPEGVSRWRVGQDSVVRRRAGWTVERAGTEAHQVALAGACWASTAGAGRAPPPAPGCRPAAWPVAVQLFEVLMRRRACSSSAATARPSGAACRPGGGDGAADASGRGRCGGAASPGGIRRR